MQEFELAQPREVRGPSAAVVRRQNVPALGDLVPQAQRGVAIYALADFSGRNLEARLGLDGGVGAPRRDRRTFVPLAFRRDEFSVFGGECSVIGSAVEERRRQRAPGLLQEIFIVGGYENANFVVLNLRPVQHCVFLAAVTHR